MTKTNALDEAGQILIGVLALLGFLYTIYLAFRGKKFPMAVMLTWLISIVLFYSVPFLAGLAAIVLVMDCLIIWIYGAIAAGHLAKLAVKDLTN